MNANIKPPRSRKKGQVLPGTSDLPLANMQADAPSPAAMAFDEPPFTPGTVASAAENLAPAAAEASTALTVPERARIALKSEQTERDLLSMVEQSKAVTGITNPDGRAQCHAMLMGYVRARSTLEDNDKVAREDLVSLNKGIVAEKKRLAGIIEPEEARLRTLRDAWDAKIAEEKRLKAEAEQRRIQAIQSRIEGIRGTREEAIGKKAADIAEIIATVDAIAIDETFAEFKLQADSAKSMTLAKLRYLHTAAVNLEAEQKRLADERAEFDRQQAEQTRVSAIRTRIDGIRVLRNINPGADSAAIAGAIESAKARLIDDSYAELRDEAQAVLQETIEVLTTMRDGRKAHEEAQAVLAAERERIAAEARKAAEREAARHNIHQIRNWIVFASSSGTLAGYDTAIAAVSEVLLTGGVFFGDLLEEAGTAVDDTLTQLRQSRADLAARLAEQERVETDQQRKLDIQAIRNQLAYAIIGRSDDSVHNARKLVNETFDETLKIDVSIERFGDRAQEAAAAKEETLSKIRELIVKLGERELAEQRAEQEREELAEQKRTLEADQKRLDDERVELDRRQTELIAPAPPPVPVEPTPNLEAPEASEPVEASAPRATDVVTSNPVNSFDGRDEPEAAILDRRPLTVSDPATLAGLKCQEASPLSFATYIPCNAPAGAVVWHEKDKRAYVMCAECAWHNVKNRGGRLLMATDQRVIP